MSEPPARDFDAPDRRPSLADVDAAAARLVGRIVRTPLIRSEWLSTITGADVWLKLETLQPTGSFKVRGALNAAARLREAMPGATTVVTASAGNHGLGLAWAAKRLGLRARVHVPAAAPAVKRRTIAALGAELVEASTYEAAEEAARAESERNHVPYISPYAQLDVIAGAATVAQEMLEAEPAIDTLVVPVGGGGLLAGTAVVARGAGRPLAACGAEAAASPAFTSALAAGRIVTVNVQPTLADGLAGNMEPDSPTFALVRDLADRVVVVDEPAIAAAMRQLIEQERLIVEGAAAVPVAALASGLLDVRGHRVGVVLSGRNVDVDILQRVLASTAWPSSPA